MGDILTEEDLRTGAVKAENGTVTVGKNTFVTEHAYEFMRDRNIELVRSESAFKKAGSFGKGVMSYTPIASSGANRFVDYKTGKGYSEKPEYMTHLRGNILVEKNHPRIVFRGKLDSLEALIMQTQIIAEENGYKNIADDLEDVMNFVQHILACEVKEEPLSDIKVLGLNSAELRYASHHLTEVFGIQHSVPHYSMGKVCASLNSVRTFIRETELAAATAFTEGNTVTRSDIIEALNRLSSAVYIIFCKKIAGQYEG